MTASDWRDRARAAAIEEAQDLELPSGMVIQARRPDPGHLLMWQRLPLGLSQKAFGPDGEDTRTEEEKREQGLAMIATSRDILIYCCVEPRISLNPGPDEIHPRDVPLKDALFILRWAMRRQEAGALESFREKRANDSPGSDGQAV